MRRPVVEMSHAGFELLARRKRGYDRLGWVGSFFHQPLVGFTTLLYSFDHVQTGFEPVLLCVRQLSVYGLAVDDFKRMIPTGYP